MQSISDNVIIFVQDVKEACSKQKRNKSPGLDAFTWRQLYMAVTDCMCFKPVV